jgi:hypothetical protein
MRQCIETITSKTLTLLLVEYQQKVLSSCPIYATD